MIGQSSVFAPTVLAIEAAKKRGVTLVAPADSELSRLARIANHELLRTESISYAPAHEGASR